MISSWARYAATGVKPLPTWYASSACLSQITVSDPVRTLSLPSQADLVAVGSKSILVRVDGDGGHSELVGRPEDADSDLLRR